MYKDIEMPAGQSCLRDVGTAISLAESISEFDAASQKSIMLMLGDGIFHPLIISEKPEWWDTGSLIRKLNFETTLKNELGSICKSCPAL